MASQHRHLRFDPDVKAQLAELAYQKRTTPSVIIRGIIETYADEGLGALDLAAPGPQTGLTSRVNFLVDSDVWDKAQQRCVVDMARLPEVVRRAVTKLAEGVVAPQ